MLLAAPQLISFRRSGVPLPVPAGAVIAWTGLIAAIPAGWLLCDGTAGTPNLTNRFIRATSEAIALRATGDGSITGTTSTNGAHTGPGNAGGTLGGPVLGSYGGATDGDHSHTITGTLDLPKHHTLAYIKAAAESVLPAGAVVWSREAAVPAGLSRFDDLDGRFIKGVADNTRAAAGVDARAYALGTTTNGAHTHYTGRANNGGGNWVYSAITQGAHNHGTIASGTLAQRPPFMALMPLLLDEAGEARGKLVLAYDGALEDLPDGWHRFEDMNGLFPLGEDAPNGIGLLSTGGSLATTPLSGAISSTTINHNHEGSTSSDTDRNTYHGAYSWVHDHTYAASIDPMVPYLALHFITKD